MGMAKHGPRVAALKNSKKIFEGGIDVNPTAGIPSALVRGTYEDSASAARPQGSPVKTRAPFTLGKG